MKHDFLLEIYTEEIPASYIEPALIFLKDQISALFEQCGINFSSFQFGATPRRFFLYSEKVAADSLREEKEIKGPSATAAYQEGDPTHALKKFMAGNHLNIDQIYQKNEGKGDYIFAKISAYQGTTQDILQKNLPSIISNIPFPKKMRWLPGKESAFARPLRNLFVLFHNNPLILSSGNDFPQEKYIYGRFYYRNEKFTINSSEDYFSIIKTNGIELNIDKRKILITEQLKKSASIENGQFIFDEDLINTVNNLVETPFVGVGNFDPIFLEIPDRVLVSVMKDHQKYFPLYYSSDKSSGSLMPKFLFVANQKVTPSIIKGNERVIRARFKDAQFFFHEDKKNPLSDLHERLTEILFTKETGNLLQKFNRISYLLTQNGPYLKFDNGQNELAMRAAYLAKCDLLTNLVFEFPELQGYIGSILAKHQGEHESVCRAIEEQYFPQTTGAPLPQNPIGIALAIAERIDSLVMLFLTGKAPTGSADPYALRRQAATLVEILIAHKISIDLVKFIENYIAYLDHHEFSFSKFKASKKLDAKKDTDTIKLESDDNQELLWEIIKFVQVRCRTNYATNGFSHDQIDAVLVKDWFNPYDQLLRLHALKTMSQDGSFQSLITGYKRIHNILKSAHKKEIQWKNSIEVSYFEEDVEHDLYQNTKETMQKVTDFLQKQDYIQTLSELVKLRVPIDAFFEKVMIMTDNIQTRDNRLALLDLIDQLFSSFGNFSVLQ